MQYRYTTKQKSKKIFLIFLKKSIQKTPAPFETGGRLCMCNQNSDIKRVTGARRNTRQYFKFIQLNLSKQLRD